MPDRRERRGEGRSHQDPQNKKAAERRLLRIDETSILLDLGFFELDMLLRNRIIFPLRDLVGHCARILFGHIKITCLGGGEQLDLDCGGLGHRLNPCFGATGGGRI